MKGWEVAFFWRKGFFSREKENIDILGNFGHFVAQKAP
jgi:hypothetical protein